jgi:hypothetical protein
MIPRLRREGGSLALCARFGGLKRVLIVVETGPVIGERAEGPLFVTADGRRPGRHGAVGYHLPGMSRGADVPALMVSWW